MWGGAGDWPHRLQGKCMLFSSQRAMPHRRHLRFPCKQGTAQLPLAAQQPATGRQLTRRPSRSVLRPVSLHSRSEGHPRAQLEGRQRGRQPPRLAPRCQRLLLRAPENTGWLVGATGGRSRLPRSHSKVGGVWGASRGKGAALDCQSNRPRSLKHAAMEPRVHRTCCAVWLRCSDRLSSEHPALF